MLPRVGVGGLQAFTATYFVPSVSYAIRGHSRDAADVCDWHLCDIARARIDFRFRGQGGHQPPIAYYRFANGFAMARAQSMNACANGLRVRPCRVMTPIGRGGTGDSSGNALSGRFSVNCNIDTGSKVTKQNTARGCCRESRSTTTDMKPAAKLSLQPIRNSPVPGSARNSSDLTPCRSSSNTA